MVASTAEKLEQASAAALHVAWHCTYDEQVKKYVVLWRTVKQKAAEVRAARAVPPAGARHGSYEEQALGGVPWRTVKQKAAAMGDCISPVVQQEWVA